MSKDFSSPLKDNGRFTLRVTPKTELERIFKRAWHKLALARDYEVSASDVLRLGCELVIQYSEDKIRQELKEVEK